VAVLDAEAWGECEPAVGDALRWAADRLDQQGWAVSRMPMPAEWVRLPEAHSTIMAVEVAHNLRARLGADVEAISASARAIVERGDTCPAEEHAAALAVTAAATATLDRLAESIDLILAPSALGVAPVGLDFTGDPVMCRPWTLLCAPASNLPYYRRADGLPVGIQAVGTRPDDTFFLTALASLEAALTSSPIDPAHPEE
jgi:Asp-tRNA(Asn)/Glu-tRNA(Gln) amidotransferase A subunit family amidase